MAQTGDVQFGDLEDGFDARRVGTGGSSLGNLPAEFSREPFARGTVGMARSQSPNSANSQFFICFEGCGSLTGQYTLFGEVVSGMDAVRKIKKGSSANNGQVSGPDKIVRMRMQADATLSGLSSRKIGVIATRKVAVWNGSTWVEQPTRNPVWAALDIWSNHVYSAGLPLANNQRDLRIEHQVTRVELNFIPAIRPGQPVLARIMHEAWNPQLQRFDIVPRLVVQTPAVVRLAAEQ